MKRSVLSLILVVCLLLAVILPVVSVSAADSSALEAADILNKLGLFGGTGTNPDGTPNYALEKDMNRMEAVTMLVRLLGKEQEAKDGTWEIPFTDVADWAKPYVGYAYANGLTAGLSETKFGAQNAVTAPQYLTFLLRALGYVSGEDFEWDKSFLKTDELCITSYEFNLTNADQFSRGDAVLFSVNTLVSQKKDQNETLLDILIADNVISHDKVENSGILSKGLMADSLYQLALDVLSAPATKQYVNGVDGTLYANAIQLALHHNYDGYRTSGGFDEITTLKLRPFINLLKLYFKECTDGNYADTMGANRSFMTGSRSMDIYLFTDGEGYIIGYGQAAEKNKYGTWSKFLIAKLDEPVDSRTAVAQYVKIADAQYSELAVVSCESYIEDNKYYYAFSNIPEDAVWVRELPYGSRSIAVDMETSYDHKGIVLNVIGLTGEIFTPSEVTDLYSHDAFYKYKQSGKAYTSFIFYDKDLNPVGQALGVLDIEIEK